MNVLAVLLATVVAFVIGGAYYAALGTRLARLSPVYAGDAPPAVATVAVELVRSLVVAAAVAGLAAGVGLGGVGQALLLALVLWMAFPVVLLAGSVFHERYPATLAAAHAGDWLLKLAAIAVIVTVWR